MLKIDLPRSHRSSSEIPGNFITRVNVPFTIPLKSKTPAALGVRFGRVDAYPKIFPTAKTAVVMSCILTFLFLAALSIRLACSARPPHFFRRRCIPYMTMQLPFFLYRGARRKDARDPDEI